MKNWIRIIRRKIKQFRLRNKPTGTPTALSAEMRLQISQEALERIQNLMDRTELRDPTVLFNRALTSFNLLTEHVDEGGKIVLQYNDGTSRIFDPISFKVGDEED